MVRIPKKTKKRKERKPQKIIFEHESYKFESLDGSFFLLKIIFNDCSSWFFAFILLLAEIIAHYCQLFSAQAAAGGAFVLFLPLTTDEADCADASVLVACMCSKHDLYRYDSACSPHLSHLSQGLQSCTERTGVMQRKDCSPPSEGLEYCRTRSRVMTNSDQGDDEQASEVVTGDRTRWIRKRVCGEHITQLKGHRKRW